ncbi:MAG: aminopeptidase [Holdemanella sp.]|nr:aminopeptidase [Holdemanella sp.]
MNAWLTYDQKDIQNVMDFAKDYMDFISMAKTERLAVKEIIRIARAYGYRDIDEIVKNQEVLKPQDKVYFNMMNKSIALLHIGDEDLKNGLNILGAHIDSPRLDLKQRPLYESDGFALLDTHYYGGIKRYQWVTTPLAMIGVVCLKDGKTIEVNIGNKEEDPVFVISDLLVHLSATQLAKKGSEVVEAEDLNVTFASMPLKGVEKEAVKANALSLLKNYYGFEEEDFVSAEIEMVPAGKARSAGIDQSMVLGYGQDDKSCAYPSLMALLSMETVKRSAACLLVDKEEIGSEGPTSMQSFFFENFMMDVFDRILEPNYLSVRKCFSNSCVLSSDVGIAHDPNYAYVSSPNDNQAKMGHGLIFMKYTGSRGKALSNDANAEFVARIRYCMDKDHVNWQTSELGKVDQGGGGTIAKFLARYGMEVLDCGVPVISMHATHELISKADLYEAYKGYKAFLTYNN